MKNNKFQPILLGSDINVYGMARSFHEEYGIVSDAYASTALAPTKYSAIVNVHVEPGFDTDPVFINTMRKIGKEKKKDVTYLLIACGDGYVELVGRHKEELSEFFICPYINEELMEKLTNKVSFYSICEQYELPYPDTYIITKDLVEKGDLKIPFSFPVALKAANSIEYLDVDFAGRKKAYVLDSLEEVKDICQKIYQCGYTSEMVCQDFIPGGDENMRVLNAYVDQDSKVRMMCLGHPLLEDPSPASIGNYSAILPDFNQEIYDRIKSFLERIGYVGFANFDMKYDTRDQQYKLFEINIRQGRSSYYVTWNGYNLAKYLVEDRIMNTPFEQTTFAKSQKLWLGAPESVLKKYAKDGADKEQALALIAAKQCGHTLFYSKDMNLRRYILMKYAYYNYKKGFKTYFSEK
ncbi:carboxylate--amine ligase [Vagococcus allomyrinae]